MKLGTTGYVTTNESKDMLVSQLINLKGRMFLRWFPPCSRPNPKSDSPFSASWDDTPAPGAKQELVRIEQKRFNEDENFSALTKTQTYVTQASKGKSPKSKAPAFWLLDHSCQALITALIKRNSNPPKLWGLDTM